MATKICVIDDRTGQETNFVTREDITMRSVIDSYKERYNIVGDTTFYYGDRRVNPSSTPASLHMRGKGDAAKEENLVFATTTPGIPQDYCDRVCITIAYLHGDKDISFTSECTVLDLMSSLEESFSVLYFKGQILEDVSIKLSDLGVVEGDVFQIGYS